MILMPARTGINPEHEWVGWVRLSSGWKMVLTGATEDSCHVKLTNYRVKAGEPGTKVVLPKGEHPLLR